MVMGYGYFVWREKQFSANLYIEDHGFQSNPRMADGEVGNGWIMFRELEGLLATDLKSVLLAVRLSSLHHWILFYPVDQLSYIAHRCASYRLLAGNNRVIWLVLHTVVLPQMSGIIQEKFMAVDFKIL